MQPPRNKTYAWEQGFGRHLDGHRCGSGMKVVFGSVSLLACAAAHLCRTMTVLFLDGSVGLVVVVIFSRRLGRSHGKC